MIDNSGNEHKRWTTDSASFPILLVLIFIGVLVALGAAVVFAPLLAHRASVASVSKRGTACNAQATVTNAVSPDYPQSAAMRGLGSVTTMTEVIIAPNGKVAHASIFRSSGNAAIDNAALVAARASTYSPRRIGCHRVTATYLFRADFSSI